MYSKTTEKISAEELEKAGINKANRTKMMEQAKLHGAWYTLHNKPEATRTDEEKTQYIAYEKARESNPEQFELYCGPIQWSRGVEISQHVDTPMHLLFLGIVRTITRWVPSWAVKMKQTTNFAQYVHDMPVKEIIQLKLSWVKLLPYTGGQLAGWVSENYLAHGRLLKWFYGWMDCAMTYNETDANGVQLHPDPSKWTLPVMKQWLKARNITPKKEAKAADLKDMITLDKNKHGGETQPVPVPTTNPYHVVEMIQALQCMLSVCMSPTMDQAMIETCRTTISIFLTLFARCDKALHSGIGTDKYKWISAYNFMSLLNIPSILENYGPLRNLWEGGNFGEGSLRNIKPIAATGMTTRNWSQNLLKNVHFEQSRKEIMRELESPTIPDTNPDPHREKIFVYKTVTDAKEAIAKNKPLSVTYVANSDYYYMEIQPVTGCTPMVLVLERKSLVRNQKAGMAYWYFSCVQQHARKLQITEERVATLFLPVPRLKQFKASWSYACCYSVIDENWKELDAHGVFNLPQIAIEKYMTGKGTCFEQRNGVVGEIIGKWFDEKKPQHTSANRWIHELESKNKVASTTLFHGTTDICSSQSTTQVDEIELDIKTDEIVFDFGEDDESVE
jgi:hypothetical protein